LHIFVTSAAGTKEDASEAARFFTYAAERGMPDAQNDLGTLIMCGGGGMEQSSAEGLRLFRLAAEQNLPAGQYSLGLAYNNGAGTVFACAFDSICLGARGCYGITGLLLTGFQHTRDPIACRAIVPSLTGAPLYSVAAAGVPQHLGEAAKWLKLAAEGGHENAITNLPLLLDGLFPAGTKIKLYGLKAAALNGLCGVVVGACDGNVIAGGVGKVGVLLDSGRSQAIPYTNLQLRLSEEGTLL
jgi:TPR repeat protein